MISRIQKVISTCKLEYFSSHIYVYMMSIRHSRDLQYQYKIAHIDGRIQRSGIGICLSFMHEKQVNIYQKIIKEEVHWVFSDKRFQNGQ